MNIMATYLEVDVDYPKNLHDCITSYHFYLEKMKINKTEKLSTQSL